MSEQFMTRETVQILKGLHLDYGHDNLKDWHRRGILSREPVGKGNERSYSFDELVFLTALAFVAPHMKYGGLAEAHGPAMLIADAIRQVYATGPDGDYAEKYPAYVLVYEFGKPQLRPIERELNFWKVAAIYGFRGAVLVSPGYMAINLHSRIGDVLAEREGFANAIEYRRSKQTD